MRIEPHSNPHLTGWLTMHGKTHLLSGFEVDELAYSTMLERMRRQHPEQIDPTWHEAIAAYALLSPEHRHRYLFNKIALVHAVQIGLQILGVVLLLWLALQSAHAQSSSSLTVRVQNAGTTVLSRINGTLILNCDGTDLICTDAGNNTVLLTSSGGGGGGGCPAGTVGELQYYLDSTHCAGSPDLTFDSVMGLVQTQDIVNSNLMAYNGYTLTTNLTGAISTSILNSLNGLYVTVNENAPLTANNANLAVSGSQFAAYLNGTDHVSGMAGLQGYCVMNSSDGSGSSGSCDGLFFGAYVDSGNVIRENSSIATQAFNFSGVPITGIETGLHIQTCQNDGGEANCYGILIDDVGGPTNSNTGNPQYSLYLSGAANNAVIEGNLAIDTGLMFQGKTCSLVAGVMTCV